MSPAPFDHHGRTRKSPMTSVRWSDDEYKELTKRAKAAKLPIPDYIRAVALGKLTPAP